MEEKDLMTNETENLTTDTNEMVDNENSVETNMVDNENSVETDMADNENVDKINEVADTATETSEVADSKDIASSKVDSPNVAVDNYKYSYISQEMTKYDKTMHLVGKLWMGFILVLLLSMPFIIASIFGTSVDTSVLGQADVWVFIISQFIGAIAEVFIYCGMLGKGGTYLAFVTGNLSTLKIPCALNAQEIIGTKQGTKENEIISTISIATSSIVTTIVLIIGVAAFVPLTPVFQEPILAPAFNSVVYALFGAMLVKYVIEYPKLFVLPLAVAVIFGCAWASVGGKVSTMMIVCAVASIGSGLVLLKLKKI